MQRWLFLIVLGVSISATAQMTMTVEQLKSFLESSVQLKQSDKQVAGYLKKIKLSERLDDRTVENLQGIGIGPKTLEALHSLEQESAGESAAAPPPPKVIYVPPPPPNSIEQKKVLAEATDYALNYNRTLPDYICTQVTRRYVDPRGRGFIPVDTIVEKLTYFEHKEDYKVVLVNSTPMDVKHEQLGGASSSGEFGTMLNEIFDPKTKTSFDWERWGTLRKRRNHVFSYRVDQEYSQYRILVRDTHQEIVVGYHGLIYVDNENHMINRITMVADGIPAGFPVQDVSENLDYEYQNIGPQSFLLPYVAEMRSRQGQYKIKNHIEFRNYRKFGVEANITFDKIPDSVSDDQLKEQPTPAVPKPATPAQQPPKQ